MKVLTLLTRSCSLVLAAVLVCTAAQNAAAVTTLNATDRGWYGEDGLHETSNLNYIVGDCSGTTCLGLAVFGFSEFRNFFVFDLSGVTDPIAAAKLRLFNPSDTSPPHFINGFFSDTGSEIYLVSEVSTSVTFLINGIDGLFTFFDLGEGTTFGSVTATSASNGTFVEIILNSAAITALNQASGFIAFGGSISPLNGVLDEEALFAFSESGILSDTQLELTFVAPTEVVFDWQTVSDPGNACDPQPEGCFGSVADPYRISKYEVSNEQYTVFLNAVAASDPNGLYDVQMASPITLGGITRSGSSGSYSYNTIAGRENMPVNNVSWFDSLRFANWLHNDQPTGVGIAATEDGAYDMSLGSSAVRKAGAVVFLTSEDEWYKAAYYKGGGISAGYWDYPAGSDTKTTCAVPGATSNTANCLFSVNDLTDGGSYTGSASPSGTFDQGGNVWEWNESIIAVSSFRVSRGGGLFDQDIFLGASSRIDQNPFFGPSDFGFRVASPVPEPGLAVSLIVGALLIEVGRRRRAACSRMI